MSDKIKVKAKELVVEYDDGQTVVINAGETGLLTEAKANALKDGGLVTFVAQKGGKKVVAEQETDGGEDGADGASGAAENDADATADADKAP